MLLFNVQSKKLYPKLARPNKDRPMVGNRCPYQSINSFGTKMEAKMVPRAVGVNETNGVQHHQQLIVQDLTSKNFKAHLGASESE